MAPRYMVDFSLEDTPYLETDVIVVGTGIAGLYTAIKASAGNRILMITKKGLFESNTRYAQGGIAAVISHEDSPEFHVRDTLIAGAGLCSRDAVDVLVGESPLAVQDLIQLGAKFDEENGELALTKEGAHSHRRILHADGDATGLEIVRTLSELVRDNSSIRVWEHHFVIDLITKDGECYGVLVEKPNGERVYVQAKATVLCCGGAGQLYRYTTNPEIATGDGVALAYRAGAVIRDMEFMQFHPTALCYPGAPRFLISEALRGEGAFLRNSKGERFMMEYHPQLELAPRDVVARAIINEMEKGGSPFVYIDITHESASLIKRRFPNIYDYCLKYGLDLTADWIPVAPAAHYLMGGVKTDLNGQTSVRRLFACGEVSSTGVHGANRLASNSLSEALVFGQRIAAFIDTLQVQESKPRVHTEYRRCENNIQPIAEKRLGLQKIMLRYVGLKRTAVDLQKAYAELEAERAFFEFRLTTVEEYEFANLITCALLTTKAALMREESRGGHYREDFPERDDCGWLKHLVQQSELGILEERKEE